MNKTPINIHLIYSDSPLQLVKATAIGPVKNHYPPERILWIESDLPTYQEETLFNYFLTSYAQFVMIDRKYFHRSLYDTTVTPIEQHKEDDLKSNKLAQEEAISAYTELKIIEERIAKLEKSLSQILNHLTP